MSFFKKINVGTVPEMLAITPEIGAPVLELTVEVMEHNSALSRAETELVAAYVGGLNTCTHSYEVHKVAAERLGFDKNVLPAMLKDLAGAELAPKLKAFMFFVRKMTLTPQEIGDQDIQDLVDAGWEEKAIHDASHVVGLFNYMNRMTFVHGIKASKQTHIERGEMIAEIGYEKMYIRVRQLAKDKF